MTKSARLTATLIREAMRVVGDCRDVGSDPAAWNLRVACFFMEHLRSVFTSCFTLAMPGGELSVQQVLCTFWSDNRLHARWEKLTANYRYRTYLSVQRFAIQYAGQPLTVARQDLISGAEWRTCEERATRRSIAQDELMLSAEPYERGLSHVFSINRADGDRPFAPRERNLVRFVHEELGRLFGVRLSLTLETQGLPTDLSPRQQSVFICLLSGDSDKQIASRLGLSVHTVHEYVTAIFRRFSVHSRGELFSLAQRNKWTTCASP